MATSKGKAFRLKAPQPLISLEETYSVAKSQDTDSVSSDDSVSILSQSVKRKLPLTNAEHETRQSENARQTSPSSSSGSEEFGQSASKRKPVSEWSVDEVKNWASETFDEAIAGHFQDEEIDGRILLSQTVRTEEAMDKLGLRTIGKKGKFLAKIEAFSGDQSQVNQSPANMSATLDRLLTHQEKKSLSCEDKRIYNTKKKMVLAEINKEWPPDKDIPSFRQRNMEDLLKLGNFVRRLTEGEGSSRFLFQKCGFGASAVREMVMSHMRERRRKEKDASIVVQSSGDTGGDTESVESSGSNDSPPSTQSAQSAADKRRIKEYGDYFHPSLTQSSCDVIVLSMLKKNSIREIQLMKDLKPLKKLFALSLLRGQDKNTYIRAAASAFYSHNTDYM
ncbi:hypothetical protein ACROYT_G009873 [Oculina patagonica]